MTKGHWKSAVLTVVLLVLAGWVVWSSETFQTCINSRENQTSAQHAIEGISNFRITFELYRACSGQFMHDNGDAVTAFFTIVLAISTILLWRSVRTQSSDMDRSIKEAARSATAMETVAEHIAVSAQAAQESVTAVKERTAQQMRAYLTVIVGSGIYQETANNVRFGALPLLINTGQTPAHDVRYRAMADILPFPLPDHIELNLPDNLPWVGGAVLGPHQNFTLNAHVDRLVNDRDIEDIKSGRTQRVYVWGTVTYRGVFGESQRTDFSQSVIWLPNGTTFGNYHGRNSAT